MATPLHILDDDDDVSRLYALFSLCFLLLTLTLYLYRNLIGTWLLKKSMVLSKQQPFPTDHLLPIFFLLLIQIIKLRKSTNTLFLLLLDNLHLINLSKIPPRILRNQLENSKIEMGLEKRTKMNLTLMGLVMLTLIRRLQKLGPSQVFFHCFFLLHQYPTSNYLFLHTNVS